MTWRVETGADGLPSWRGQDAILNTRASLSKEQKLGAFGGVGVLVLLVLAMQSKGDTVSTGIAAIVALFAVPIGLLLIVAMVRGEWDTRKWFRRAWVLKALPDRLAYNADAGPASPSESWEVELSRVASVEAGRSSDWEPARKVGPITHAISPHEWQTFLVLADQTRRLIYTANADREGCAKLAASIRAHVEASRAKLRPATVAPSIATGEGFDL